MARAIGSLVLVLSLGCSMLWAQEVRRADRDGPKDVASDTPKVEAAAPAEAEAASQRPAAGTEAVLSRRRPAVQAVLARPEAAEQPPRRRMVYRLGNVPAVDMAKAVNEMLAGEVPAGAPGPQPPRDVVVVPEPVSNSLLISAAPRAFDEVVEMIQTLDQHPRMVAVRVTIAEETLDEDAGKPNSDDQPQKDAGEPSKAEVEGLTVLSGLGQDLDERIRAMQDSGRLKVLSRPTILTLDNQPAFLKVGQRVPVVSSAGSSDRPGQPVQVVYEEVGLTLGVTPRIGPDGIVVMEVDAEKSDVEPAEEVATADAPRSGDAARPPRGAAPVARTPLSAKTHVLAQTTIAVKDGRTVVLGGLVTKSGSGRTALWIALTPEIVRVDQ